MLRSAQHLTRPLPALLAAEEGWPKNKLRAKLTAIRDEQQQITRQLEQATNQLETGRQIFLTALDLLDNPYELYKAGNETVRSILNRTFFPRLYVDGHKVTGYELTEPFDVLNEAYTVYRQHQAERQDESGTSNGGQSHGHNQGPGVYYRRTSATTVTGTLTATLGQPELPAGPDTPRTTNNTDLQLPTSN